MRAIDHVKRDHEVFRVQLDVVERALGMDVETWNLLQELSVQLSKRLRDHRRREALLAVLASKTLERVGSAELARFAIEHDTDQAILEVIKRNVRGEWPGSLERILPAMAIFAMGLRRHMAEQEAKLFPLIERLLGSHETDPSAQPTAFSRRPWLGTSPQRGARNLPRALPGGGSAGLRCGVTL